MSGILDIFKEKKPIIGMIHCKGNGDDDTFERAMREIGIYRAGGVDAVMVETYFGDYNQVVRVLDELKRNNPGIPYGVNCLNIDAMGFELAARYDCDFLQIDSVIGHVKPRDEATLAAFFETFRPRCRAFLMGGVRFKYQPVLSEKTEEEDLLESRSRCDAVCVTGDGTGMETSLDKIKRFRSTLGDFPLFVCAGLTTANVYEQLQYADGAVVGSWFKDTHKDDGEVCAEHVAEFMQEVRRLRADL